MMEWNAQWIWDGGEPAPVNAYRIFRKTFTLPEEIDWDKWTAYICADTRYKLLVNGRTIARGPASPAPGLYAYDEIACGDMYLAWGEENIVVVIVHYVGAPTFDRYRNRGGLLFQMGDVVSDETWQVAKQSPWLSDTPRLSVQQGFCEYYAADWEPYGMLGGEIEPDEWMSAVVVCPAEGGAWPILEPRGIPMPAVKYCPIVRLLEWGNCSPAESDTVAGEMTEETLMPLTRGSIERDDDNVTLTPDGADIYLLYDLGEEVSGFLDFATCPVGQRPVASGIENALSPAVQRHTPHREGGIVDIGYDETLRVGETRSGLKHDWGGNCDIRYADRFLLRGGDKQTFQNFSPRAFRFVRLAFRNLDAPVTLTALGIYESTYPVNRRGTFLCSDARLNQIWEVGRRTLQLCMDDKFMDCPWRERAQWVGDALVEGWGAALCFGDTYLLRRMLRMQAAVQRSDGWLDPVGPGEWDIHAPGRPIPGFVCLWVVIVREYLLLTADTDFCASLLPTVRRALDWLQAQTDAQGLLTDVNGWNFIDWAPGMAIDNETGTRTPLNLQHVQALRAASELARGIGDADTADEYAQRAQSLAAQIDTLLWDEARTAYADLLPLEGEPVTFSQHTQCLAMFADVGLAERQAQVLETMLHDPTLTQIGSPYFSFYLLRVLYKQERHADALGYIRTHWGRMLDAGATTWWEDYNGQSSLCHAWSCGPTIDLITQTLGVSPAAPGWKVIQVAPHPVDLSWAKGIVPTPHGDVSVSWNVPRDGGGFVLRLSTPQSVTVRPILPAMPPGAQLTVNGTAVNAADLGDLPGGGYEIVLTP